MEKMIFEKASADEVKEIFSLYEKRVEWMEKNKIHQWNETDYLGSYPKPYYEEQQKSGNLYVLKIRGKIAGAAVVLRDDARWKDFESRPSFYVHNLVTDIQAKGAGKVILGEIEKFAKESSKDFVRLDCARDNSFLNSYYESQGYLPAGECEEGLYKGILRQKKCSVS